MAVVEELLRKEEDGSISFGNHKLDAKAKVEDFEHRGDLYKVKTFKTMTKLERNGMFVYESVPGTSVTGFQATEAAVAFQVEGPEDAQITLELEAGTEYNITINAAQAGVMKTNLGGKLSISVELDGSSAVSVGISKK